MTRLVPASTTLGPRSDRPLEMPVGSALPTITPIVVRYLLIGTDGTVPCQHCFTKGKRFPALSPIEAPSHGFHTPVGLRIAR